MKAYWFSYAVVMGESHQCVRCGEGLYLREGCDWPNNLAAMLCQDCAIAVIEELLAMRPEDGKALFTT